MDFWSTKKKSDAGCQNVIRWLQMQCRNNSSIEYIYVEQNKPIIYN